MKEAAGLLCVGETLALMTSRSVGPLAQAPELTVSVGGAEGNVAIGAPRLGVPTTWVGRLGRPPGSAVWAPTPSATAWSASFAQKGSSPGSLGTTRRRRA